MARQPLGTVVANPTVKNTEPRTYVALEHVESGMGRLLNAVFLAERQPGDSIECAPGDVLFGKLRPYLAKSLMIDAEMSCSSELLVLRPNSSAVDPRFLSYIVQSHDFVEWANRDSYGVKMPRTSWPALSKFPIPVLPPGEQQRTVEDLDIQTAKFDEAIESKRRLLSLLDERRRSAIVDAITGGPERRAGGAYREVGHVAFPPEWSVMRVKDLVDGLQGGDWGEEATGDGVAVVRAADFNRKRLTVEEERLPRRRIEDQKLTRLLLKPGDLVMEKSGGGEQQPVGMVVAFDLPIAAVASNFAARVRPSARVEPRFLLYVFAAIYFSGLVTKFINQTTGIQNIDTEEIVECEWAIPQLDAQSVIAAALDEEMERINRAAELTEQEVALLQERRRAMITRRIIGDRLGEGFDQ